MEQNKLQDSVSLPQTQLLIKALFTIFVFASVFLLPFYIHNQLVTGSLVNAGLLVASFVLGVPTALLLSFAPSVIALLRGLLPVSFAPIVPFIIASNIFYVLIFQLFPKKKILGGVAGSVVKFVFLYTIGQALFSHIIVPNLLQKASLMVGWFQLITSLIGAGIAVMIEKTYQIEK